MTITMRYVAVAATVLVGFTGRAAAEDFRTIDNGEVRRQSTEEALFNFLEKLDGRSTVAIRAKKATAKFSTGPAGFDEGSKIDGKSKVLLEVETAIFNAKVDGKAIVLVIVSKGGRIEFNDKIDGEAEFYWCKADDGDPDPTIKTRLANPRGKSKYNQVSRAEMDRLIRDHDLK